MKTIAFLFATLLTVSASAAESVATLGQIEGQVLVNQGKQFVKAQAEQLLLPGDRVMLLQESSAILRFKDGCDARLPASVMVIVPEASTCAGGVLKASRVSTQPAQAAQTTASSEASPKPNDTWVYVAGGVAVAVLASAAGGSDDDTVSP